MNTPPGLTPVPFQPNEPAPKPVTIPLGRNGEGGNFTYNPGQPFIDRWHKPPPPQVFQAPLLGPSQQGVGNQLANLLQQLLGGQGPAGAQAASDAAMHTILSGQPAWTMDPARLDPLLQRMQEPAYTRLQQELLPQVRERAGAKGLFHSSDRARMEQETMRRMAESMSAQRAQAMAGLIPYEARSSDVARQTMLGGLDLRNQLLQSVLGSSLGYLRIPQFENLVEGALYNRPTDTVLRDYIRQQAPAQQSTGPKHYGLYSMLARFGL